MTVLQLVPALSLTPLSGIQDDREITGGYAGDLLSWVMGRCPAGAVWITIMQNVNVAAVASLCDAACVILAEGVSPDPALLEKAAAQGITLLSSPEPAYLLAGKLYESLL